MASWIYEILDCKSMISDIPSMIDQEHLVQGRVKAGLTTDLLHNHVNDISAQSDNEYWYSPGRPLVDGDRVVFDGHRIVFESTTLE